MPSFPTHSQVIDSEMWEKYLAVASIVDAHMIDDWESITDVTFLWSALFSGILAAFTVELLPKLEKDPTAISNALLLAIYHQMRDPSTPLIDINAISQIDPAQYKHTVFNGVILFISLGTALMASSSAGLSRHWTRYYQKAVNSPGTPYQRAMARHRAFRAMQAWKFDWIMRIPPLLLVVSVCTFGHFVYSYVAEKDIGLGYVAAVLTYGGFACVMIVSFAGAFIPSCPFQSPISEAVACCFGIFGQRNEPHRVTPIYLFSVSVLVGVGALVAKSSVSFITLVFVPIAAMFSLFRQGSEVDMAPRRCEVPFLTSVISATVVTLVFISGYYAQARTKVFLALFTVVSILICTSGYLGMRISESVPDTTETEALAWLITSSVDQAETWWYKKAVDVAGTSDNLRAQLLKELLPLLTDLIISPYEDRQIPFGTINRQQAIYIECLAKLADFYPSNGSFFRNEAPLGHGQLSPVLRRSLQALEDAGCPDSYPSTTRSGVCVHGVECLHQRVRGSVSLILQKFPIVE